MEGAGRSEDISRIVFEVRTEQSSRVLSEQQEEHRPHKIQLHRNVNTDKGSEEDCKIYQLGRRHLFGTSNTIASALQNINT